LFIRAFSLYYSTNINLQMSFKFASEVRILQCVGIAFLFVPLNTLSYVGTNPEHSNDVSGLINLARNIGGSVGTSVYTTVLARHEQRWQHYLTNHTGEGNPGYTARISALIQQALAKYSSLFDAQHHAMVQFYRTVQEQAAIRSYIDVLSILAVLSLIVVPLPFLLKKLPKGAEAKAH
jgi:DHA2 family multidrug resistance protein